jgi:cleavage and polyadenylation specificity factor subunit 3
LKLDCGIHPAKTGVESYPYWEGKYEQDLKELDLILITHFHLDHCAGLPVFLKTMDFRGRVFMTPATKSFFKMVLNDFMRVSDNVIFFEKDINDAYDRIECINYREVIEYNGIRFTCYNAGHVLGAAMFMLEINGCKIMYTGFFFFFST